MLKLHWYKYICSARNRYDFNYICWIRYNIAAVTYRYEILVNLDQYYLVAYPFQSLLSECSPS